MASDEGLAEDDGAYTGYEMGIFNEPGYSGACPCGLGLSLRGIHRGDGWGWTEHQGFTPA